MSNKKLWVPSKELIENCQLTKFIKQINDKYRVNIQTYNDCHSWSIENIEYFWKDFLYFSNIKYSGNIENVVDNLSKFPGAKWFPDIKINYAENLLKFNNTRIAIESYTEDGKKNQLTYNDLNQKVSILASYLKSLKVGPGDRVAAVMPNIPETIIGMLATASLGAIWTSCSPEFGESAILDRFEQVSPKILIASDGYTFKGKYFSIHNKINNLSKNLSSLKKLILVNFINKNSTYKIPSVLLEDILSLPLKKSITYQKMCFNDPLYIMYSSGTTGKPKSIVHSIGGTLIQHLKELILHVDLKQNEKIFYFTTCGWMMWNWLVSSLSIGSTIVLYEGNPFYPKNDSLLQVASDSKINIFGTSAKYIDTLEKNNIIPKDVSSFPKLRSILSTGSPLLGNNFDFIYNSWKKNIQLSSISGGTDIISCFALGSPLLPVFREELQCIGLGMDVKSYNENGDILIGEKGELVCQKIFPSMPIKFWNDSNNKAYKNAYFKKFSNVWTHGDYISINLTGGVMIHGRSDSTLNPGGVRIGTSEIYKVVEQIEGIIDSVAIGRKIDNDEKIILFVKMREELTKNKINQIKSELKDKCSPRHVPFKIIQVKDIPYTLNGKKVEVAIKKILDGKNIENKESIINPEALNYFKKISI